MANTTTAIAGPIYPGSPLRVGSSGSETARVQTYLNALQKTYPTLRKLTVDGRFGSGTQDTVRQYQALKGLSADGVVGRQTWDTLIREYNDAMGGNKDTYPGIPLRRGSDGQDVRNMQAQLTALARTYPAINALSADGKYGANTEAAVRRFQQQFGLSADGVLGQNSWNGIVAAAAAAAAGSPKPVTTPYPGTPLRQGSTGDNVRFLQSYLNGVAGRPFLAVDGNFGADTKRAVGSFQAAHALPVDGVAGANTWAKLIPAFNDTL